MTDDHFAAAAHTCAQNQAQSAVENDCQRDTTPTANEEIPDDSHNHRETENKKTPPRGAEHITKRSNNIAVEAKLRTESGAFQPEVSDLELGLNEVIYAWPRMAEDAKAAILAMVRRTGS